MQLGIRYVLPAIPFLILFASQAARWFDWKAYPLRTVTTSLLTGWMLLSVRYHPDHLAYFNELAGGPLGGREHLLDSNLDWGQDLGGLKAYLDKQHEVKDVGLAYFGTVPPSALGNFLSHPALAQSAAWPIRDQREFRAGAARIGSAHRKVRFARSILASSSISASSCRLRGSVTQSTCSS